MRNADKTDREKRMNGDRNTVKNERRRHKDTERGVADIQHPAVRCRQQIARTKILERYFTDILLKTDKGERFKLSKL